jgi:hypothetical protein
VQEGRKSKKTSPIDLPESLKEPGDTYFRIFDRRDPEDRSGLEPHE